MLHQVNLKIQQIKPGHYLVRATTVNKGVEAQVKDLLSRLKRRIAVLGIPMGKQKAFYAILMALRQNRTVEISVL
jgi:hypothetical protein